jgi:hypothetical protein
VRGGQVEIDLIAEAADDPELVLVGEVKHRLRQAEIGRALRDLQDRAARCPVLSGHRIQAATWVLEGRVARSANVIGAARWLRAVEAAR